jgi:hypothetical protein
MIAKGEEFKKLRRRLIEEEEREANLPASMAPLSAYTNK